MVLQSRTLVHFEAKIYMKKNGHEIAWTCTLFLQGRSYRCLRLFREETSTMEGHKLITTKQRILMTESRPSEVIHAYLITSVASDSSIWILSDVSDSCMTLDINPFYSWVAYDTSYHDHEKERFKRYLLMREKKNNNETFTVLNSNSKTMSKRASNSLFSVSKSNFLEREWYKWLLFTIMSKIEEKKFSWK